MKYIFSGILVTKFYYMKNAALIMNPNGMLAVSIHAGLSLCIFTLINNEQPTAYMDEIFHVPQARKYCYGKFKEVS